MCVNKEVSLISFIFVITVCTYLFKRNNQNDRWIAIVFGYIGLMQLIEFFMWIDQKCKNINIIATKIGFFQNLFQPLISIIIALYFTKKKLNKFHFMYVSSFLYIIFVIPRLLIDGYKKTNKCTRPCSNNKYGLSFIYTDVNYPVITWQLFALALIIPFTLMNKNSGLYITLSYLTYIIALIIERFRKCNEGTPASGSWWCLLGAIIPFFAIFINK